MYSCTRRLEFDAGHRVLNHESKCRILHGHRYVAEFTFEVPELDELGRVVDFGVLKSLIGGWIDANLDHNMILHPNDPLAGDVKTIGRAPYLLMLGTEFHENNPTVENLAKLLYRQANELINQEYSDVKCVQVKLFETPNCWSIYPTN